MQLNKSEFDRHDMTQPQKDFCRSDFISLCHIILKTSAVHRARIRIIIYDNKNMPSSRKPHHDSITSMHCIFLHHVTLNTLHRAAACYFKCTVKCCNILPWPHCTALQHVTLNALWSAATSICTNQVFSTGFISILQEYKKQAFPGRGTRFLPFLKCPNQLLHPPIFLFSEHRGFSLQGVKQPRHEAHNWPCPSAEVKNDRSYTPSPVMGLHGVHKTTYLYLFKVKV